MSLFSTNASIDLIIGPMFSGKTTELFRRLSICTDANFKVLYINSILDDRDLEFSSHNETLKKNSKITFVKTNFLYEIAILANDFDVIGIDEAQFFPDIKYFSLNMCENHKKKLFISGLNGDFERHPFGQILDLVTYCDSITKLYSFCSICRKDKNLMIPALFTKRINVDSKVTILVGKSEYYIPVCRNCYHS